MPTFDTGVPCFDRPIVTPYGLATVRSFHENGTVDIYAGQGRVFTVSGSTPWREAKDQPMEGGRI